MVATIQPNVDKITRMWEFEALECVMKLEDYFPRDKETESQRRGDVVVTNYSSALRLPQLFLTPVRCIKTTKTTCCFKTQYADGICILCNLKLATI